MDQKEQELLAGLERLMVEYNSDNTSNSQKSAIEQQLQVFSAMEGSWKQCLYFVKNSSNPYVAIFALNQLEHVIDTQWDILDPNDQIFLKESLSSSTLGFNSASPSYIRNKLFKVQVELVKNTWDKSYLEHFTAITKLLQNEEHHHIGLIMLRTTSEEILSPNCNLSSNLKDRVATFCAAHIPKFFELMNDILAGLVNRKKCNVTTTPPPSPTNPSCVPSFAQQISAESFRPDAHEVAREAMNTLQHFFSWVNITQVPLQLLHTVFKYTNVTCYAQDDDDICILALSVLNELLYRKSAPPGQTQMFMEMYQHSVVLLRDISQASPNKVDLGLEFIEKLSETLSLLIGQHLWRLETVPSFTALEFLANLFTVTVQMSTIEGYILCLHVWRAFIKQIKPQYAQKYSEALMGLVLAVLNKMQYTLNAAQLEELNNSELIDDDETKWEIYLYTTIEIIASVAEFAPMLIFKQVLVHWETDYACYIRLSTIDVSNGVLDLQPGENERLHCVLKDLASLTQMLGRLSTYFNDSDAEHYSTSTSSTQDLLAKLIEAAEMSRVGRFYQLLTTDLRLVDDFTDVHCQFLAALKTWCIWYSVNTIDYSKELNKILHTVLPLVSSPDTIPPRVTLSAAHVLLSVTSIISPSEFIQNPETVVLIQAAPTLAYPKNQSRDVVLCALAMFLLRPWGDLSESDAQTRQVLILNLFDAISREYREMNAFVDSERCLRVTESCLPCFVNIIDYCKGFPAQSKRLLYEALKTTIDHGLTIFPVLLKFSPAVELKLQFFVKVLEVLQQQMGVVGVRAAVDVFHGVALQCNEFTGMDMLLKILQLVIEAPGTSHKNLMQGIFELCMNNVYPTLIQQANEYPDAIIALINLMHSILLNRWNHFYVSQIRLGHSPGCSDDPDPPIDSPQQQELLLQILEMFGHCLLQSDINISRVSLSSLENLNSRWKLYHKVLFKEQLLCQFLSVLLKMLLDKSHVILQEDIVHALYNMAAVSFPEFFGQFLTQYVDNIQGLSLQERNTLRNDFSNATDMPTFVQDLQRFINDARCFLF